MLYVLLIHVVCFTNTCRLYSFFCLDYLPRLSSFSVWTISFFFPLSSVWTISLFFPLFSVWTISFSFPLSSVWIISLTNTIYEVCLIYHVHSVDWFMLLSCVYLPWQTSIFLIRIDEGHSSVFSGRARQHK